jgi:hypothetical protein
MKRRNKMCKSIKKSLVTLFLIVFFITTSFSSVSAQWGIQDPDSSATLIVTDLVIVRPTSFATMLVGCVGFVAILPFTLIGGNVGTAGQKLVANPARATFGRPLGDMDPISRWPFKYNYQE